MISLYLDMDGVFCDFSERVARIYNRFSDLNGIYSDELKTSEEKEIFQGMVDSINNDKNFWKKLKWMPNGEKLYNFILKHKEHFKISILTAPLPGDNRCAIQKSEWVFTYFDFPEYTFICDKDKEIHINSLPNKYQVLIDDRYSNIEKWKNVGGIGILHNDLSVDETIKQLEVLIMESKKQ